MSATLLGVAPSD